MIPFLRRRSLSFSPFLVSASGHCFRNALVLARAPSFFLFGPLGSLALPRLIALDLMRGRIRRFWFLPIPQRLCSFSKAKLDTEREGEGLCRRQSDVLGVLGVFWSKGCLPFHRSAMVTFWLRRSRVCSTVAALEVQNSILPCACRRAGWQELLCSKNRQQVTCFSIHRPERST